MVTRDLEIQVLPAAPAASPPGLADEAKERLVLGPTLLGGDIGEICGAVATAAVVEGEPDAMDADLPVKDVVNLFKVGE